MSDPVTRPGEMSTTEAKKIAREMEARLRGDSQKFGERTKMSDGRLTKILAWMAGILAVFVSTAAIWATNTIVSVDKQVGILLARPLPVSKEQYDQDRKEMLDAVKDLQRDVSDIKEKRAEARYGR